MNNTEHQSSFLLAIFLGKIPSGKMATSKKTHIFMVFETLSSLPQKHTVHVKNAIQPPRGYLMMEADGH